MREEFKIKEELRAKYYTTERLLDGNPSCLRKHIAKENCKILDIGCGQSTDILDLIKRDYTFTAVDSDQIPLDLLRNRIREINPNFLNKVDFVLGEFPSLALQYEEYDAILFHSLLHFFSIDELLSIFKSLNPRFKSGAVLSIVVHSVRHLSYNKPTDNPLFKHYFNFDDLKGIFPESDFEMILEVDFIGKKNKEEIDFLKLWCREVYMRRDGIRNERKIEFLTNEYLNKSESQFAMLHYIIKKR